MKFGSLLIVTYGRSGSTLLQGVLNSIDGVLVRGENYGLCEGLFSAYASLVRAKAEFGSGDGSRDVTSPWFGAALLAPDKFIEDTRALLRAQLAPGEDAGLRLGFKEIRYLDLEPPRAGLPSGGPVLHAYLDFLALVFPQPAFVVLTRDHAEVAKSAWWKRWNPAAVSAKLDKFEQQCASYAEKHDNVYRIDYADVTGQTDRLRGLFEFLGAAYDRERLDAVLNTRHSYPGSTPRKTANEEKTGKNRGAAQPKAAQRAGAKPTRQAVPAAAGVEASRVDTEAVAWLRLQGVSGTLAGAAGATLSGSLVLAPGIDGAQASIDIVGARGEPAARWGLPSPKLAERFPDNPNAANARFRITGLRLAPGKSAEVRLAVPGQASRVLLCLGASAAGEPAPADQGTP